MKLKILLFTILICSLSSCQEDWLEEKRSISMVVPQTLNDMRMILNNNRLFYIEGTFYADASADDYYITESIYNALDQSSRNHYTWGADLYEGRTTVTDWNKSYEQVLNANIILEGLEQIDMGDQFRSEYNDIKGGALYFRSKAFLNLAMQYAPAFNANEAQSLMGIPLRLSSDIHTPVVRATLEETYKRITEDLSLAASLLADVPEHPTDASKAAAYGLLARCYLYMGDYANALSSAENSLQLYSELLDYNSINPENNFPFQNFNKEVLIYGVHQGLNALVVDTRAKIVPELYDMYDENDLRKQLFFRENTDGTFAYRGSYTESRGPFNGVTVSEIFLIKAECEARLSQTEASMTTLNHLLEHRYKEGSYHPHTPSNDKDAIGIVLDERRKEMVFRGQRWFDLKRLGSDPDFAVQIKRTIGGTEYVLPPNDPNYVFPIPPDIIAASGIPQNPRD